MTDGNYWNQKYWPRVMRQRLSRRRLIQIGTLGTAGVVSAAYLGCGGDEKNGGGKTPIAGETPVAVGTPRAGGTLTAMAQAAFSSWDPALVSSGIDKIGYNNIYDAPINRDIHPDGSLTIKGNLAESWEWVDPTHLKMTFRKGIKFTDGTDFTAEAVKFAVERTKNPETKSTRTAELRSIDHVELSDAYTMTYVLSRPDYVFLTLNDMWACSIPSPTAVEKWGSDFINHPTGTGAFMLQRQESGASYELVKNPNFWQPGEPYLDGYNIQIIPDKAVAASALKSGQVDFCLRESLDSADIVSFQKDSEFKVSVSGAQGVKRIFIAKTRPPGDNIHLRKAMTLAINREEFVAKYSGLVFITPAPLPRQSAYNNPDQPDPEFNLEKAKAEMKLAGLEDGVTIRLSVSTDPTDQSDGELMMQQLAKIGVKCELDSVPPTGIATRAVSGSFDFLYMNFPADIGGMEYIMREIYHSKGVFNVGITEDPNMDAIIEKAWLEPDIGKRRELYWQVMKIAMDGVYEIPIIGVSDIAVMRKNIEGYVPISEPGGPELEFQFRRFWLSS